MAVRGEDLPVEGAARVGVALAGLGQELGAARREIAVLKRENTALRCGFDRGSGI